MDYATWEQFFRTNPNPTRFYVDQVKSAEELMKRFSYRIEGFQNLNQQLAIQLKKSEDLKSQGCAQIKEKVLFKFFFILQFFFLFFFFEDKGNQSEKWNLVGQDFECP